MIGGHYYNAGGVPRPDNLNLVPFDAVHPPREMHRLGCLRARVPSGGDLHRRESARGVDRLYRPECRDGTAMPTDRVQARAAVRVTRAYCAFGFNSISKSLYRTSVAPPLCNCRAVMPRSAP